jgi:hypothetical protein
MQANLLMLRDTDDLRLVWYWGGESYASMGVGDYRFTIQLTSRPREHAVRTLIDSSDQLPPNKRAHTRHLDAVESTCAAVQNHPVNWQRYAPGAAHRTAA